jgi:ADP-heptose:LPS heptosyltransferase
MVIFRTGWGVGDVLLTTGVIRAWRRIHGKRVIVETRFPELFLHNPDVSAIWQAGTRSDAVARMFGHRGIWRAGNAILAWFDWRSVTPRYPFPCPGRHLIDAMADTAAVTLLPQERRPFLWLTAQERAEQEWAKGWVAVQGNSTTYWTANKDWVPGRIQNVVDGLRRMGLSVLQLGDATDEPLQGVKDLRGKTSLRQVAAVLANACLFVGLEGGLVHLARAVETRSVVIYTGYTKPEETGYPENANLRDPAAGEGCWRRDACDHCAASARSVTVDRVMQAVESLLMGEGAPAQTVLSI